MKCNKGFYCYKNHSCVGTLLVKHGYLPAITHCSLLPFSATESSVALKTEDDEDLLTESEETLKT